MSSRSRPAAPATLDPQRIRAALPTRATGLVVAFSGGIDSTVLLHLAVHAAAGPVRAVHVHHGLQPAADDWATHCQAVGSQWGVAVDQLTVTPSAAGEGIEAAARAVRYRALAAALAPGECLMTAHHADDQLETLLFRMLRGTGTDGLVGIQSCQAFAAGWLIRPLLDVSRQQIEDHARACELGWVDDPSNTAATRDRNYLRHHVIPAIKARWPQAGRAAQRLATHAREQRDLTGGLLHARRVRRTGRDEGPLPVDACAPGDAAAATAILREWLHAGGLNPPNAARLRRGLEALSGAGPDRAPRLEWADGQIRRHGNWLFRLPPRLPVIPARIAIPRGAREARWATLGRLTWSAPMPDACHLRMPTLGEQVALPGRPHKPIREIQREWGIVPWWRDRLPVLVDAHGQCLALPGPGPTAAGAERGLDPRALHWRAFPCARGPDWTWWMAPFD